MCVWPLKDPTPTVFVASWNSGNRSGYKKPAEEKKKKSQQRLREEEEDSGAGQSRFQETNE